MAFITSLRIKNFFSINDEVTLDFKASPYNIENNLERLFEFNGEYYNKIISLYGANASGKTTVLKAITALSFNISNQNDKLFFTTFKNKFSSLEDSSKIGITFVLFLNDEFQKFFYEIEFESINYENIGICNEKLLKIEANEKKILIDRRNKVVQNIDDNIIKAILGSLSTQKSLIQELYKFEDEKNLEKIYNFFTHVAASSNMEIYNTQLGILSYRYEDIAYWLDNYSVDSELEKFYISFFNSIGLDIVKIEIKYKEFDIKKKEFKGIDIFHNVNLDEPLKIELESDGTQMLMKVLLDIYKAKVLGVVLVLDELDSSIHPVLMPIIINLLIENDIQIIYSTHNIYNMQFLQNDEIFLIEKDSNHKTTIKPVKNNPNIKGYKNLLTLYENGYLGGLPNVKEILTKIL